MGCQHIEDIKDSFGSKTQMLQNWMLVANLQATRQISQIYNYVPLILDTWSNRITTDGRFYPDRPLICTEQWSLVKNFFSGTRTWKYSSYALICLYG